LLGRHGKLVDRNLLQALAPLCRFVIRRSLDAADNQLAQWPIDRNDSGDG
jgi:hypothetical protein